MRLVFLLLSAWASVVQAGTLTSTIVNSPGWTNTGQGFSAAFSFSTTAMYTNVSIEAFLAATPSPLSGLAFLTSQVGPTTTAANNIVAPQPFTVTSELPTFQWVTLFTGLTLGPGSYFVTLSSDTFSLLLALGNTSTTTITEAPGVTRGLDYFANNQGGTSVNAAFAPGSTFGNAVNTKTQPDFYSYRVTGDLGSSASVPEPGSMALVGLGLALLMRRRG